MKLGRIGRMGELGIQEADKLLYGRKIISRLRFID